MDYTEKINARKKELLNFIHRLGCTNITYRHIDYLFDNVDLYPNRTSMVTYLLKENELIGEVQEIEEVYQPVTSGCGEDDTDELY
jgi:hypothetical protein